MELIGKRVEVYYVEKQEEFFKFRGRVVNDEANLIHLTGVRSGPSIDQTKLRDQIINTNCSAFSRLEII